MMRNGKCELTVNGKAIRANVGETLVDAALGGRIVLPHDCCSGQCETCRVKLLKGKVDDYGSHEKDTVLACITTLEGDAEITFDLVPVVRNTRGVVESIEPLGNELLEVRVRTRRHVPWLPGQYVRVRFGSFPPRDYSPTFSLDRAADAEVLIFHVKVYPNSRVSSRLGNEINVGHRVAVRGPYGNAFLRRQKEPLVLVSTGTGFAPIWSIAVSAALGQPWRRMSIIAGARNSADLYMRQAVSWLRKRGVSVTLTAADGNGGEVRRERPSELLSSIQAEDVVYVAGAPSQVDAVRECALASGATFYADPFFAAETQTGWRDWAYFALQRRLSRDVVSAGARGVAGTPR